MLESVGIYLTLFGVAIGLVAVGLFAVGSKSTAWMTFAVPVGVGTFLFVFIAGFFLSSGLEFLLSRKPLVVRLLVATVYLVMAVAMACVGVSGLSAFASYSSE